MQDSQAILMPFSPLTLFAQSGLHHQAYASCGVEGTLGSDSTTKRVCVGAMLPVRHLNLLLKWNVKASYAALLPQQHLSLPSTSGEDVESRLAE